MPDNAFNDRLDAIVGGDFRQDDDGLTTFAKRVIVEGERMTMPIAQRFSLAQDLGIGTKDGPMSRPHVGAVPRLVRRVTWPPVLAVAAVIPLVMASVWQFGWRGGDDSEHQFLASAVPTVAMSPGANPDAFGAFGWQTPITFGECPMPRDDRTPTFAQDTADAYPQDFPQRLYGPPFSIADEANAGTVVQRMREQTACGSLGYGTEYMSWRFYYETRNSPFREHDGAALQREQVQQGQAVSRWLMDDRGMTPESQVMIVTDPQLREMVQSQVSPMVFDPSQAVQFLDGRIGLVPLFQYTLPDGATPPTIGTNPANWMAVWAIQNDGSWKIDQVLPMCLGDCNAFWANQPGATPVATPVSAMPMDARRW